MVLEFKQKKGDETGNEIHKVFTQLCRDHDRAASGRRDSIPARRLFQHGDLLPAVCRDDGILRYSIGIYGTNGRSLRERADKKTPGEAGKKVTAIYAVGKQGGQET